MAMKMRLAVRPGNVMSMSVEEFCGALAAAFVEGRVDGLSAWYVYPLPIYLPEGYRIEMTPDATAKAVLARRALAMRAGMKSVQVRISEISEPAADRLSVQLSWEFLGASGEMIDRSFMRYFCRSTEGTLRVEMMEFTRLAFTGSPVGPEAGSGRT